MPQTQNRLQPQDTEVEEVALVGGVITKVEKTSLATRYVSPDECVVQFVRWHADELTAYQKGSFAGFPMFKANKLVAMGVAIMAQTPQMRDAATRTMVTK